MSILMQFDSSLQLELRLVIDLGQSVLALSMEGGSSVLLVTNHREAASAQGTAREVRGT